VKIKMPKSLRKKSKDELEALLKYLNKAKEYIAETMNNAKKIYDNIIEKYDNVKKEIEGRNDGK
jgi:ABC-type nitrate/sulfonate/bicarbonate transport system substrate-binding protein